MKDRVSGSGGYNTENGAKRYAVYSSASATTPTEYKFLLLDDLPTETGTALTKSNLMSDTTGAKFGLDSTGTIDDVINKIGSFTDVSVASGWTAGTLGGVAVYYKDVAISGLTTGNKLLLHSINPPTSAYSKSDVKSARKQAGKIIGYDNTISSGYVRLYAYENVTSNLVARFTNV